MPRLRIRLEPRTELCWVRLGGSKIRSDQGRRERRATGRIRTDDRSITNRELYP
jgi:hypothetical protein